MKSNVSNIGIVLMSSLNTRVLTSFLRQYLYIRQFLWNSPSGKFQSLYRDDASLKTGLCLAINRKFPHDKPLIPLSEWIEILYELGAEGRKPLFLSLTLQAIRSYIVAKLLQSEYKEDFLKLREKLKEETDLIDKNKFAAMAAKKSKKDVDKIENEYFDNLLKLADLGDELSTFKAARLNLFPSLDCPNLQNLNLPFLNELNENIPFCYHEKYYRIYYELYLRALPQWQMTFDEFEKQSEKLSSELIEGESNKPFSTQKSNAMFFSLSGLFKRIAGGGNITTNINTKDEQANLIPS